MIGSFLKPIGSNIDKFDYDWFIKLRNYECMYINSTDLNNFINMDAISILEKNKKAENIEQIQAVLNSVDLAAKKT